MKKKRPTNREKERGQQIEKKKEANKKRKRKRPTNRDKERGQQKVKKKEANNWRLKEDINERRAIVMKGKMDG